MSQPTQISRSPSRKERILIIVLIVAGLILVLFFGFRAFRSYMRIQQTGLQPGVTDVEAIRGWMTVPYIATAYGVPEAYIFESIGIPQEGNQNKSLRQLNGEYGDDQGAVVTAVKAAIRQYQADHPLTPEPARD
ncbi:MAG: hypothetical protein JXM69_12475 [Anaerolineae bacterium]|nr:hypothetical protein [Anaerolineae bacterium]